MLTAMSTRRRQLMSLVLILPFLLPGCSVFTGLRSSQTSAFPSSLLDRLTPIVRPEFEQLSAPNQRHQFMARERVEKFPAASKRRSVIDTLTQPWDGLSGLERRGLLLAQTAKQDTMNLPALIDILESGMDHSAPGWTPIPFPQTATPEDLAAFMAGSLEQAARHRDSALAHVTEADRHFLFHHAHSLADQFLPQTINPPDGADSRVQADVRFAALLDKQVVHDHLIAAAQELAYLADTHWLHLIAEAWTTPLSPSSVPSGITGTVLFVQKTAYGLMVIGGPGPNTYELDDRFGLIIDLGGNDQYHGMIASSASIDHGNAVVIDLSGDDRYDGGPLGLATGRLGVGLLIDHAGNDVYDLKTGSGGAGFGGIGILYDATGNDTYAGTRLTQGVAIGGLGLLIDGSGNDRYSSHGFATGFGGPAGTGAVIDVAGDDSYQCGGRYPSAYNGQDAPGGQPGDPLYQFDCFGLGTGSGQRVLTHTFQPHTSSQAGGLGLLLDIDGDDRYESANFSQGMGYFFGAGLHLDLAGHDTYQAARYGHGASAHFGVGLFLDYQGKDRYGSTGPFYNGGVAWDRSVSLMIDGGMNPDVYDFGRTTGLGRADYSSWGLFIDEGGSDEYTTSSGFGEAAENSAAGFFDLGGTDTYTLSAGLSPQPDRSPANATRFRYPHGGVFVDH